MASLIPPKCLRRLVKNIRSISLLQANSRLNIAHPHTDIANKATISKLNHFKSFVYNRVGILKCNKSSGRLQYLCLYNAVFWSNFRATNYINYQPLARVIKEWPKEILTGPPSHESSFETPCGPKLPSLFSCTVRTKALWFTGYLLKHKEST